MSKAIQDIGGVGVRRGRDRDVEGIHCAVDIFGDLPRNRPCQPLPNWVAVCATLQWWERQVTNGINKKCTRTGTLSPVHNGRWSNLFARYPIIQETSPTENELDGIPRNVTLSLQK
ncbi:hypothetical protein RUM43_002007 [Polyplax serrata]|uniref:Uncharacterized protein n=1 Tax=Polyplax serrata TaxID=468196 RepID=A0AAN8P1R4_POLSC